MITDGKPILDACCGSRMFWFDKDNPFVEFMDIRGKYGYDDYEDLMAASFWQGCKPLQTVWHPQQRLERGVGHGL